MIFWFSGTGNSLHIAKQAAHYTKDSIHSITQAVWDGAFTYCLPGKEALGLVMPTYYWGIPKQVEQFLSNLKLAGANRPYTYVIFTCGGAPCNAISLVRKHIEVDYWNWVTMPDNMVISYDVKHPDELRAIRTGADIKLKDICKDINRRQEKKKGGDLFGQLATKSAYPRYEKRRVTKPFLAAGGCTGCGLCQELCPDRVIEMAGGKPRWKEPKCSLCLACLHRCPASAIQYGRKTQGHKRYVHPILQGADSTPAPAKRDPRFDFE